MSKLIEFITEKIPSFLKEDETKPKTSSEEETLDDVKHKHDLLINKIVTDIINFFMENKNKEEYVLELLDPTVCNDLTLFFTKDLEGKFKSYPIDKLEHDISVSKSRHKPCATKESCTKQIKSTIVSNDPKVTKWELCYTIASHYVKMLNLLAALLTGLSPEKNMCIERMNSIYNVVEKPDGSQGIEINICKTTGKKAVKDRLFEENGLRELINLYILDQMDKLNTDNDVKAIEAEYTKLVTALNKSNLLTRPLKLTQETESSSVVAVADEPIVKEVEPVEESDLSLAEKINAFDDQVKELETKAKDVDLPPKIQNDIDNLKASAVVLGKLVDDKAVSRNSVSKALSSTDTTSYSSSTSNTDYSSYSSTSSSTSTNSKTKDIVLIIDNAKYKLKDIKGLSLKTATTSNTTNTSTTTNTSNNIYTKTVDSNDLEDFEDNEESIQKGGLVKDDSLTNFNNFIKKYKEHWSPEVRKYFDDLINNSFSTGVVTEVCNESNASGKEIFFDIADMYENPTLTDFIDNFVDMKMDYVSFCDKIIYILENDLLETTKEKRTIRYSFRQLSVDDLHDLQKKCRRILLEMYTSNHSYYLKGIGYLKRYFTSAFYKKTQAQKP
jgi:hypothetical protein